jgi:hypothetical protein
MARSKRSSGRDMVVVLWSIVACCIYSKGKRSSSRHPRDTEAQKARQAWMVHAEK